MQKTLTVVEIESGQYPKAKCSDGRKYEGNPGIVDMLKSGQAYTLTLEDKIIPKKDGTSFTKTVIVNVEGLDIPVIYTCDESRIDGVHFDTRNSLIIRWNAADPVPAARMLTATIRNTLPDEADLTNNGNDL